MIFELVYKIVIVMIDINNVLRELNVLNSNKTKDNIDKLIDLIKIDQKTNQSFNSEIIFAPLIESVHLKKIVTRIIFLNFIYVVICSIVKVMIEDIKIKAIFTIGAMSASRM